MTKWQAVLQRPGFIAGIFWIHLSLEGARTARKRERDNFLWLKKKETRFMSWQTCLYLHT